MSDERPIPAATPDNGVDNAQATLRKLKRLGVEMRLPSGILGQRRKLREICKLHSVEPEYEQP